MLSSNTRHMSGLCWRFVEAQHITSTLKLVDNWDEQELLEELIEESKPVVPPECRDLDYLLSTPFRYEAEYSKGSRFRRAGQSEGVYYAALHPETALAEIIFDRLLFFAESPQTPWPENPAEYTAFSVRFSTDLALDLMAPPLADDTALWTHLTDYEPCQLLAEQARNTGVDLICYQSVRDLEGRANVAILSCRVFEGWEPGDRHTWRLHFNREGVHAVREFPRQQTGFRIDDFADDPRLSGMNWNR